MSATSKPIRVLVVDDSALIRKLLTEILSQAPDIEVVAAAADPFDARTKIKQHEPDVLTLDVEMPKMDGITFLRNLMRLRPMPVVMVSSLTEEGADVTLEALEVGAVDFVTKPKVDVSHALQDYADVLIDKVRTPRASVCRHAAPHPPRHRSGWPARAADVSEPPTGSSSWAPLPVAPRPCARCWSRLPARVRGQRLLHGRVEDRV